MKQVIVLRNRNETNTYLENKKGFERKKQDLANMLEICPECGGNNSGVECELEISAIVLSDNFKYRQKVECKHCHSIYATKWVKEHERVLN